MTPDRLRALVSLALEDAVPWTVECVECTRCGDRAQLVRQIGDTHIPRCIFCHGRNEIAGQDIRMRTLH